jgi:hypothetical protein
MGVRVKVKTGRAKIAVSIICMPQPKAPSWTKFTYTTEEVSETSTSNDLVEVAWLQCWKLALY